MSRIIYLAVSKDGHVSAELASCEKVMRMNAESIKQTILTYSEISDANVTAIVSASFDDVKDALEELSKPKGKRVRIVAIHIGDAHHRTPEILGRYGWATNVSDREDGFVSCNIEFDEPVFGHAELFFIKVMIREVKE